VAGDRRKTRLCCTEKAQPIIQQGRQLQEVFLERLFRGIDPVTKAAFLKTVTAMNENLDELLKGE
jgi:DNA-binding MarR family transcriptional regulator